MMQGGHTGKAVVCWKIFEEGMDKPEFIIQYEKCVNKLETNL
jgi:hypothetical protein